MNLYVQLKRILKDPPLQWGQVIDYADGVATVQMPGGGLLSARGTASIGDNVYVRNDVIEGIAPDLPLEPIDVDAT